MKDKGFTLVELLGVLVILSIIMLIAVPNVISIMDKNKKDIYISDAKKMVAAVQYELSKKSAYPEGSCYVKLSALSNIDLGESPNKGSYKDESYIVVTKESNVYTYTIYLTDGNMNINGITLSALKRSSVMTGDNLDESSGDSCY